jgi:short-subunit dehydrogenase
MTPEGVAAAGLRALDSRRSFLVTHPLDRLWISSLRLAPRTLPAKIAARLFRRTRRS